MLLNNGALAKKNEIIYELYGKKYTFDKLNDSTRQLIYEAEKAHFETILKLIDRNLLESYIKNLAVSNKKSIKKIEEEYFAVEVTPAATRHWYEENKARLGGRNYEDIKSEIMQFLVSQKQQEVKDKLVTKIKKDGKFSFSLKMPKVPKLEIDIKGAPFKGKGNAKVTIVEFADYLCPHCKIASQTLAEVYNKVKGKVKFVFLDFPLRSEGPSVALAQGGVCAQKQNKFWEYHYHVFENQSIAGSQSPVEFAKKIGLDVGQFQKCLHSKSAIDAVAKSRAEGERIGIQGTPAIYVNGKKIAGYDADAIIKSVNKEL